jgi:hypothetical protein
MKQEYQQNAPERAAPVSRLRPSSSFLGIFERSAGSRTSQRLVICVGRQQQHDALLQEAVSSWDYD